MKIGIGLIVYFLIATILLTTCLINPISAETINPIGQTQEQKLELSNPTFFQTIWNPIVQTYEKIFNLNQTLPEGKIEYSDVQIIPYSNSTKELTNYNWVINQTTKEFYPDLKIIKPLTEFHWLLNKLETQQTCTPINQYSDYCYYEKLNFSTFEKKNQIDNKTIKENKDKDGNIISYLISYYGQIFDLDPVFDYVYETVNHLMWKNITEGSTIGARITAPVLYMNFNKAPENLTATAYINGTNDYVQDNSVYNNKGDIGGLLNNGQWVDGNISNALQFDGRSNYVSLASRINPITYTGGWSAFAWVKYYDNTESGANIFSGYLLYIVTASNKLAYYDSLPRTSTGALTEGVWTHIGIVCDNSTNSLTFYINGANDSSSVANCNASFAPRMMYLGTYSSTQFFKGMMDEADMWNRTITQNEIDFLYANNTILNNTGLVLNMPFNESSGFKAVNYGNMSNNGTLSNFHNSPTYNSSCTAYSGSGGCYEFNGLYDYLELNRLANLSSYTNGWTLYAWVNHYDGDVRESIFGGYALHVNTASNKLDSYDGVSYKSSTRAIQDGVWTQVTATCLNNNLTFYINGTWDSSQSYNCRHYYAYKALYIGAFAPPYLSVTTFFWNGSIDDTRIWDRALSTNEIATLYADATSQGKYSKSGDFKSLVFYNSTSQYWNTTFSIANSTGQGLDLTNPNLVMYYPLDENYTDMKGGNDGTCTTNCPRNATGVSSDALWFDGINDQITLPYVNIGTSISYSLWFKYTARGNALDDLFMYGRTLIRITNPSTITYYPNITGGTALTYSWAANSNWNHLAVTQTGSNCSMYLNGVLAANRTDCIPVLMPNYRQYIVTSSYGYPYSGLVDEVLIYNDTLTSSEIDNLYKTGLSQHASTNISMQSRTASNYNLTDSGLVSQWSFNSNETSTNSFTDDKSTNNGSCLNITFCPVWNDNYGVVGAGYQFDGLNDYINLSNSSSILTNAFGTISAWIKYNKTGAFHTIVGYGGSNTTFLVFRINTDNTLTIRDEGTYVQTIATLNTNQWYHVAAVSNGSSWSLYLNGVNQSVSQAGAGSGNWFVNKSQATPKYLTIGNIYYNGAFTAYFNGSIDDLRIYNRSLTASEIQDLYNLGNSVISDWTSWSGYSNTNDGVAKKSASTGKFYQFQAQFSSNDTTVSPYLLNHSVGFGGFGDITPPNWITIPSNQSVNYGIDWNGVQFNATDDFTSFVNIIYSVNNSNFTINTTGFLDNASSLMAGSYAVLVTATDEASNYNTTIYILQVNKSSSSCSIYFNATSPLNYPDIFKVFTNCSSAYSLKINNTAISNNSVQNNGVGYFNFSVQRADIQNYSNTYDEKFFTINKGNPPLILSSSAGWTLVSAGYSTITGSGCQSQIDCFLWELGVNVTNPYYKLFSAGLYPFIYNTSGNENYSGYSITNTLNSQINTTGGINITECKKIKPNNLELSVITKCE